MEGRPAIGAHGFISEGTVDAFLGEYPHSLDDKGRLILPAKFRAPFEAGAYLAAGQGKCLAVYTPTEWESVLARAQDMARAIAANSPLAVQGAKQVLGFASRREVDANLDYVALWNAAFLHSEDLGEAMRAFLEKRQPSFRGQ